mmetsp:Transcript_15156/g.45931  ORF Transcript_15156/g.45931 Transcript_15156/m.45931 type:complete len:246 (-) Transcript_15156:12-749(-)
MAMGPSWWQRRPPTAGPRTHEADVSAAMPPRIAPRCGLVSRNAVKSAIHAAEPAVAAAPPAPRSVRAATISPTPPATPVPAIPIAAVASPNAIMGTRPTESARRPQDEFSTTRIRAGVANTMPTPLAPMPRVAAAYCGRTGTTTPKPKFSRACDAATTPKPVRYFPGTASHGGGASASGGTATDVASRGESFAVLCFVSTAAAIDGVVVVVVDARRRPEVTTTTRRQGGRSRRATSSATILENAC